MTEWAAGSRKYRSFAYGWNSVVPTRRMSHIDTLQRYATMLGWAECGRTNSVAPHAL